MHVAYLERNCFYCNKLTAFIFNNLLAKLYFNLNSATSEFNFFFLIKVAIFYISFMFVSFVLFTLKLF